jgi:hypothetical protein
MKRYFLVLIISFTIFFSCKEEEEKNKDVYFNGEIIIVDSNVAPDTLYGEKVNMDGLFTGAMWAYDTLIGFFLQLPDYNMNVFNVNTGKFLYSLGKRGTSAKEFNNIGYAGQFVYEDSQLYVWIQKDDIKECVLLNLEKPGDVIKRKTDINVDTEFRYGLSFTYILNDSLFLGSNQGEKLFSGDGSLLPPAFHLYNAQTKELIKSYKPYNALVIPSSYDSYHITKILGSRDRIKPGDNTKLVMAMFSMDQINILDIATGKIKGYRNKNSPDFTYLKDIDNIKNYYLDVNVDDKYIYGLSLNGKNSQDRMGNILHVFDWDGNFIRKIVLDKMVLYLSMAFDPVNKYLYIDTLSEDDEEIYRYDVSYLYK